MARRKKGDGVDSRSMRCLELERMWGWLPTFRVVAECENAHEASRVLRLSTSSISRTIRLLERELGCPLFARTGSRLQLNPAGRQFLGSVRRSMRLVDDGAKAIQGPERAGAVRVSLPEGLASLLAIPVARSALAEEGNGLFCFCHETSPRALSAGLVDLIVATRAAPSAEIEVRGLGDVKMGVYCGREHALWDHPDVPFDEVVRHRFIASPQSDLDAACWPAERRRRIAIELADQLMALDACVASLGLAVLPCAAASPAVAEGRLRWLPGATLLPAPLFAMRRSLLVRDRVEHVIASLASAVSALTSAP